MNRRSLPTSVLLDKGVVREALRGVVRIESGLPLPERQAAAYRALVALRAAAVPLYATQQLLHILQHPRTRPLADILLPDLVALIPGRYLRRWARRLHEEGFSREDAVIVAYGSFGFDPDAETFGADAVLTTDLGLRSLFESRANRLQTRFDRMVSQLRPPYRDAGLPVLHTPEGILEIVLGL